MNKKINAVLIILISMFSVVYSVSGISNFGLYQSIVKLAIIPLILIPKLINKKTKLKISYSLENTYILFMFFSHYLGNVFEFYRNFKYFDKIIHFSAGVLGGLIAIYFLMICNVYNKKKKLFNVIFLVIFSLAFSNLWELFEYAVDYLFDSNMQRIETGMHDTMGDIAIALIGTLLFIIYYCYEVKSNKKNLIEDFLGEIR